MSVYIYIYIYDMLHVCPPTSDVEHGLMAVAGVCDVGGNTAENSSIRLPHARHLEDALRQESVSGRGGGEDQGVGEALNHKYVCVYVYTCTFKPLMGSSLILLSSYRCAVRLVQCFIDI